MTQKEPTVSIGLPVKDGEAYLDEAIRSILGQTYTDLELIISDNASTDRTEEIALGWEADDSRVRYVRNPADIGAAPNFHQCFRLSRGKYFKWAAHDDLLHPKYVELCLEALEMSPEVVLAHTTAEQIDADGAVVGQIPNLPDVRSGDPVQRFTNVITQERLNLPIFGLMRSACPGHDQYPRQLLCLRSGSVGRDGVAGAIRLDRRPTIRPPKPLGGLGAGNPR